MGEQRNQRNHKKTEERISRNDKECERMEPKGNLIHKEEGKMKKEYAVIFFMSRGVVEKVMANGPVQLIQVDMDTNKYESDDPRILTVLNPTDNLRPFRFVAHDETVHQAEGNGLELINQIVMVIINEGEED
jgi:hypothetical protein